MGFNIKMSIYFFTKHINHIKMCFNFVLILICVRLYIYIISNQFIINRIGPSSTLPHSPDCGLMALIGPGSDYSRRPCSDWCLAKPHVKPQPMAREICEALLLCADVELTRHCTASMKAGPQGLL